MSKTNVQINENEGEWHIRGEIDLTSAAAVSTIRGSNQVAAKTATGTYTVTVKGTQALKLVETLDERVVFARTVPATALGCRISSVANGTGVNSDDIVITIKTMALPTSGADTDTTAATTLSFQVVIRTIKMGNPL